GTFDVVLGLGILYHMDADDAFGFVERIGEVCDRVAVIDTHISLEPYIPHRWRDQTYWGTYDFDHPPETPSEHIKQALWDSPDTSQVFYPTLASLCNLLRHAGFTSVHQIHVPSYSWIAPEDPGTVQMFKNRVMVIALKGRRQKVLSSPYGEAQPELD